VKWWNLDMSEGSPASSAAPLSVKTPGGIPVHSGSHVERRINPIAETSAHSAAEGVRLRIELARLRMLRGFEELLCLEGLQGVEHLPHQIETVRKVLRHFRGRVLLADEVGLGKTIEASLLLREYLLRGLVKRVLILTPAPLTTQWHGELAGKFGLQFAVPPLGAKTEFWEKHDRVLASLSLAKSRKHFEAITAVHWDLVVVDEAHHCKNRGTRNWQLVNALQRRHLFLLTATPVQNNLVELYNLLTLLEPGHLKTESDFKRNYVARGNPRDPVNRERLRRLLGEVMVRNTRSMVNLHLPRRYAQTFVVTPGEEEAKLYRHLDSYLRWRLPREDDADECAGDHENDEVVAYLDSAGLSPRLPPRSATALLPPLGRMQINAILMAAGSHPLALAPAIERLAAEDERAGPLAELVRGMGASAKEQKLLELLRENRGGKTLVFANFRNTIDRLDALLTEAGIPHAVFSGRQTTLEKQMAIDAFRNTVPVLLSSDSGGEGQNLQFASALINFDLPWNPMRIEQRVGRLHRIGQTHEVFVFNLCTAGSLEQRILSVLEQKIQMFELVIGEVGSILGNLEDGEEFESLVLKLWLKSRDSAELDAAFDNLGESLLTAQDQYLKTKELDEALFGEDYQ
jgi:SNF2 family DNA or RNA helicase